MLDFQIPQVRPVNSGASGPEMDWRPFIYALPVAGVLVAAHTVEAVSSIALRISVWAMDGVISVMAGWLDRHEIDAGADVFAGISIIASAIGATYVIGKQVKASMDAREAWEAEQAEKRAKHEMHAQARGASIEALMDASKGFSLVFFDEVHRLAEDISTRHRQVSESSLNRLMEHYNGEVDIARWDMTFMDEDLWSQIKFAEVPDYTARSTEAAKHAARLAEAVEARVMPFFDVLKLKDHQVNVVRESVQKMGVLAAQIDELNQISRIWERYSSALPPRVSPSDLQEGERAKSRAEKAQAIASSLINAIGGFNYTNRYMNYQMQWFVDSVEGGRGDLIWNHDTGETYDDEFWGPWGSRFSTADFAEETAAQFLDTHLIRVHEWHLGELGRLMGILSGHGKLLLASLAAATRTIVDDDSADEQAEVYSEFLRQYYPQTTMDDPAVFRSPPISSYDESSGNVRLADQDQDAIASAYYAERHEDLKNAQQDAYDYVPEDVMDDEELAAEAKRRRNFWERYKKSKKQPPEMGSGDEGEPS